MSASGSGWWFEDAVPGATLRHAGGRTLGDADHVWLAWVTCSASDVHGNADRALAGPFGRPLVLGALSVAIVLGLAAPAEHPDPTRAPVGPPRWAFIRLGAPVFAGDTLRAESHIREARPAADERRGGHVERTIRGLNHRGEKVVTIAESCEPPSRRQ